MGKQRETGAAMWIDKEIHRQVKILAALEGVPASHIYEEAVTSGPVGERLRALVQRLEEKAGDGGDG